MLANNDYEGLWLLPDIYGPTTTANDLTAQISIDQSVMFPQPAITEVPCDRWGQHDWYSGDPAFLGPVLEWIGSHPGHPEDSGIYEAHEWVYGGNCINPSPSPSVTPTITPSPSPLVTPSVTPTPSPSATPTVTPSVSVTPSPTPTPELADTGMANGSLLLLGAYVLIVVGACLRLLARRPDSE